jgi:ABC-type glycerol-3-phosphate transport system permease component
VASPSDLPFANVRLIDLIGSGVAERLSDVSSSWRCLPTADPDAAEINPYGQLGCPLSSPVSRLLTDRLPMHDFVRSLLNAFAPAAWFDPDLVEIVALSLRVSLSASLIAMLIGARLGAALAVSEFWGRQAVVILMNALLGLPPVVVGLAIYLILSRSGPFGFMGLLFTPSAMG